MGGRVEHAGEGYASHTIALTLLLAVCASANADNWPRFRGPNGQGISDDKTIPVQWSDADIRWKVSLPGGGHSSPVVWGDRVFVTSAEEKSLTGTLLCVDAATGKELWRKQHSLARMPMNSLNSYAGATPALDGERVYAAWPGTEQTTLTAWTFEGKEAWTAGLPGSRARHGAGSSPILYGDTVILSCEQDKIGGVLGGWFALDRRTGQVRWRCEHPENPNASYSTPCVFEDGQGRSQLVFTGNLYGVVGVDPAKGEVLWKTPNALPARVVSSPVIAGDLIVGNCGEGARGIRMAAVKPPAGDSSVGEEVYAIDRGVASYVPTPVAHGGLLFLFHDQGTVSCLRADTGEVLWSEKPAGRYYGSPICVDGKLYCVTVDGDVVVLAAGPKYELLAVNPLGEKSHATPAVANGRMYLRTFSHLICIGGQR